MRSGQARPWSRSWGCGNRAIPGTPLPALCDPQHVTNPTNSQNAGALGQEEDEEPGPVELLAVGEEALPRLQAVIEQLPPVLEEINRLSEAASAQIAASDSRGAGFAGRLTVARQLAAALEEPGNKLVELGNSYASELVQVDPAILTLIRMLEDNSSEAQTEEARQILDAIQGFAVAAKQGADSASGLAAILSETAALSQTLRGPLRKIQQGLRGVSDGQSIIDEWDNRIKQIRGVNGSAADQPPEHIARDS